MFGLPPKLSSSFRFTKQLGLAPLQVDTSGRTVQRFLSEQSNVTEETSNLTLRAKATALYSRAANLASKSLMKFLILLWADSSTRSSQLRGL